MAKTIKLYFDGFYTTKQLPLEEKHQNSTIYIVYRGKMDPDGIELYELLYIGETKNAGTRPSKKHEKYKEWRSHLEIGEKLFYTFC